MRLFNFDHPAHRETVALLPWYVNGTLRGIERVQVDNHARECVACRNELAAQRRLRARLQAEEAVPAISSALARLHAGLDAQSPVARPVRGRPNRLLAGWRPTWLASVACAQSACIVVLLLALAGREQSRFHTLSAPSMAIAPRESLVVIFAGEATQARVQTLLRKLGARIVDGPNSRGAYTIEVPAGRQRAALQALQRERDVPFIQPAPGSPWTDPE